MMAGSDCSPLIHFGGENTSAPWLIVPDVIHCSQRRVTTIAMAPPPVPSPQYSSRSLTSIVASREDQLSTESHPSTMMLSPLGTRLVRRSCIFLTLSAPLAESRIGTLRLCIAFLCPPQT